MWGLGSMLMYNMIIRSRGWRKQFTHAQFSERVSVPNEGMTGRQIGCFDKKRDSLLKRALSFRGPSPGCNGSLPM